MSKAAPEVMAYLVSMKNEPELGHWFCEGAEHPEWVKSEPLIRLSDYEALQAECEKLRKAIRRLCNIYAVDDYYSGDIREERLNRAVEWAIDAALQEPTQ